MSTKKAAKNSIVNMVSLFVNAIIAFVVRSFVIKYLGVEILGVNATIVETVNLLSMSELGIQSAIIYKLYKPIIDKDIERQRMLFSLYKYSYRLVSLAIFVIGIVILPFLPSIVKTEVDIRIVYASYIMQVMLIVITYLVSYYRILLLANQKQYIYAWFGIFVNIFASVLQVIVLVIFKSYLFYLVVGYVSLFLNTVFIYIKTKSEYGEIMKKTKVPKEEVSSMVKDLKQMVLGTVSGYIYGSTDNVLISSFFGAIHVGFISNYKMITNVMRSVISSLSSALSPSWGDFLNRNYDEKNVLRNYKLYIFMQFVIGMVLLLPTWILLDDFIIIWIGKDFLISDVVLMLIIMDLFMTGLNEPTCVIMRNLGMFKEEKKSSLVAAISNIVSSILLGLLIGIPGIFVGTIIAVIEYWVIRSWYVHKRCFEKIPNAYKKFWTDNLIYLAIFVGSKYLFDLFLLEIKMPINMLSFALKGIVIEIYNVAVLLVLWGRTEQFNVIIQKIKVVLKR